eukprot:Opistho-2@46675
MARSRRFPSPVFAHSVSDSSAAHALAPSRGLKLVDLFNLSLAHFGVVDGENVYRVLLLEAILVHSHNHLLARVYACLSSRSTLFNAQFGHSSVDCLCHAAEILNLCDNFECGIVHFVRQRLHHVRASPRISHLWNACLLLDDDLRITSNARALHSGKTQGLVKGVGVERLGSSKHGRHSLDGCANDVVEGILLSQRPPRRLAMGAEEKALCRLWLKLFLDQMRPQATCSTHFRNFHVKVHPHRPEERETRRKVVNCHPSLETCAAVLKAIGKSERQLEDGIGARFLHVITANGDRVVLWHVLGSVAENVADDGHGRLRRIDKRIANHEFLENVVLDCTRELRLVHALFFGGDNVHGENGKHRAVHGH